MKTVFFVCIISLLMLNNASAKSVNTATKVEVLAKSTKSWNGDQLPKYSTADPEITILKITIPAGTKLPLHQHNMINAGVLLKGQLTVVTEDNDTLHMKAGDTIVEVVNKWHYGKNDGLVPAEIIVFYAGTVGEPLSIKK
ncbi:MAG: cupin domain-containing protein [Arenicella sp.]